MPALYKYLKLSQLKQLRVQMHCGIVWEILHFVNGRGDDGEEYVGEVKCDTPKQLLMVKLTTECGQLRLGANKYIYNFAQRRKVAPV